MQKEIFSIILFFSTLIASGQQHADCDKALEMSPGMNKFILLAGWGEVKEVGDTSAATLHWFRNELNTCWLKLPATKDGEMTIDIEEAGDLGLGIDFLLFKYNGEGFCNDVKQKKLLPVRSNLAVYPVGKVERTGLSTGAEHEFVAADGTTTYSKSIVVKAGEMYILVINGNSKATGNIMVGYQLNKLQNEFGKSPMNLEKKDLSPSVPFSIKVVDDETGLPLVAKISIEDLSPIETVKTESSEFSATLNSSQSIRVDINAPGYMFVSKGVMAPSLDPGKPSTFQPVNMEIRMKKLKEGDKVALRNIRFQPDKDELMPASYPALQSLTSFLQSNPTVQIEIGGHINAPDGSSAAGKALSKKRAKAVYEYLIKRGIDKKRLKYKGYGNSQMIWPQPQNERQADENRRVEIKIIKH